MTYLSRDAILQREDIVDSRTWKSPEWGGTVRVRGMSGVERDAFEAGLIQQPAANGARRRKQEPQQTNMANIRAKLASWCCVDAQGGRLFTESDVWPLGASQPPLWPVSSMWRHVCQGSRKRTWTRWPGDGRAPFRRNVYSLASSLHMSPGRFLAEHTSQEISEWMAWHKLEAADRRTAEDKAKTQNKVKGRRRR